VARLLQSLGYGFVRQRGSHARYTLITSDGAHNITVPLNDPVAKGTLNDILTQVALRTGKTKDELISEL
jgi:predicted RNA binding protein YcfA (HicA-like mRNA interferase family)